MFICWCCVVLYAKAKLLSENKFQTADPRTCMNCGNTWYIANTLTHSTLPQFTHKVVCLRQTASSKPTTSTQAGCGRSYSNHHITTDSLQQCHNSGAQPVSRRIMRSFLLSASTQAASFVPPQYRDEEKTVNRRPSWCTYKWCNK